MECQRWIPRNALGGLRGFCGLLRVASFREPQLPGGLDDLRASRETGQTAQTAQTAKPKLRARNEALSQTAPIAIRSFKQ